MPMSNMPSTVPMWKIHRLLDLLYQREVRYFLAFHRDGKVSTAERKNGNMHVLAAYPASEWKVILDNLEQHEYKTTYTDMAGGKLIVYVLPVRGLTLSDEILEAIPSP